MNNVIVNRSFFYCVLCSYPIHFLFICVLCGTRMIHYEKCFDQAYYKSVNFRYLFKRVTI